MRCISTNRQAPVVSFREALLQGQAPDRGLYLPAVFPSLPNGQIEAWRDATYPQIAADALSLFLEEEIPRSTLDRLCHDGYDFPIPLEAVESREGWTILRLDQGPTASFKDFAARLMARMIAWFLSQDQRPLWILTATSGDTGSAVAHAFHLLPGLEVFVLFPKDEVSPRQRKQMTTLGGNVHVFAVDGKFDDCQALVKRAFADPALASLPLSSANSINLGRLLPQMIYYLYACTRLPRKFTSLDIAIPCGNFGNLMGAVFAKAIGAPIGTLIAAVNENDEFPAFLKTGHYQKIEPSKNCVSSAMNVGHPSNLARLVHLYGGQMDETGLLSKAPDMERLRGDIWSIRVTDPETRQTIRHAFTSHNVLLEPHGAVAWAGAEAYEASNPPPAGRLPAPILLVETAHPAKFPDEIKRLLGFEPPLPASLAALDGCPETMTPLRPSYDDLRDALLAHPRPPAPPRKG